MSTETTNQPNAEACRQAWDVLTTALEGGYAEEFTVLDLKREGEDQVIIWATVIPTEGYEPEPEAEWPLPQHLPFKLDERTITKGFLRYTAWVAKEDPAHRSYLGQQWAECHDPDDRDWAYLDAIGADAVLQFAIYGEVVFS